MVSLETPLPSSSLEQAPIPKVQVESLSPGISAIPTRQSTRDIQNQLTQVLCQSFADRILVLVTQVGKIGCLIQVTPPPSTVLPPTSETSSSEDDLLPPILPSQQTPLLGSPPQAFADLYGLYASQIAAVIRAGACQGLPPGVPPPPSANRQIVVGLALKNNRRHKLDQDEDDNEGLDENERERFLEIMEMVKEARVW